MRKMLGRKKTVSKAFLIAIVGSLLAACSSSKDPAELYQNETPQQIFAAGKKALQDKSYTNASKRFEALDVQYPYGPETEQAQLFLIYTYYMKEDYALSVTAANHFIRMHPDSPNVDYAYYMRGIADYFQSIGFLEKFFALDLAKRDLVQIRKSYDDFNIVITRYPNSVYAPSAHHYAMYIRNILADHEFHIAEFYYQRKAYVAAANRAAFLVAHYEGAPSVVDALVLMAKSYYRLGLVKEEQDTLAVLQRNYPNVKVDYKMGYNPE